MAALDVTDSRLGPGVLELGATPDDFAMQVANVRLEPSHEETDQRGTLGKPDRPASVKTTWSLAGTLVQDWELEAPEGALEYLRTHNLEELPFRWVPNDTHAIQYSGTVQIRSVVIGGDIDTETTSDFSFPVVGDIARADVVAGP